MRFKRWILWGCLVVVLINGAIGWYFSRAIQISFSMHNQVYQETKSPDGNSVATLAYRDGIAYGFFYVTLQRAQEWRPLKIDDPILHDEVAEVASEGLESIAWKSNHLLLVKYRKSGDETAVFELKQKTWHDVAIVYQGVK